MIEGQLFNTRPLENQKEGLFGFQVLLHSRKLTWLAGNSPFSIGNTSSNGLCSIAMLAFEGISIFLQTNTSTNLQPKVLSNTTTSVSTNFFCEDLDHEYPKRFVRNQITMGPNVLLGGSSQFPKP